jgi:DNA-binding MarR family transcriptional regulator
MSPEGGHARGLREISPAPPSYRLRSKEPVRHGFHLYMPLRDLSYTASRECPSLAAVKVLEEFAYRTEVDGVTRASVREIARHLDRSVGTILYHVKVLVELGFLEQLGGCREDNRHRLWRVAGMDRREYITRAPGENHHRGGTTSRDGIARHPSTSRDGIARISVELPGELIESTRASPQQEPLSPRDWGRANDPVGIRAAREAAAASRRRRDAQSGPEPPAAGLDGVPGPRADTEAQNGTDSAAEGAA